MLNDRQITQFRHDGFTTCRDFLTRDELEELVQDMESICHGHTLAEHDATRMEMEPNQPPHGASVRRLYEPCTHYDSFKALSRSTMLLDYIEQLVGKNILFHYSKLNMKPPEIGSVVEWHQDLGYYPLTNRDALAVLFYLDDADEENGCLRVLPGRHEGHLLEHTRDGYFQGRVTQSLDDSDAIAVSGQRGTAIFIHCMTPHSSFTNRSGRSRRTLILGYRASNAFLICGPAMPIDEVTNVRLVRGHRAQEARITMKQFPVPFYREKTSSLYKLQEMSRGEGTER